MKDALLNIEQLKISFYQDHHLQQVVNGIDFYINKGEILGVLGESGSGKTVSASSILQLNDSLSCSIDSGEIRFKGENLLLYNEKNLNNIRGKKIAYIFQNPAQALNPYIKVGRQLTRVLKGSPSKLNYQVVSDVLLEVGIHQPDLVYNMYPFQLSGGQNQRIMVALCILLKPELLIADEPTSSIDASLRRKILDLLLEINKKYHMSILLITHDFDVARYMCHRMIIMQKGNIVEEGDLEQIFNNPKHEYTQKLIRCTKELDLNVEREHKTFTASVNKDKTIDDMHVIKNIPVLKVENLSKHFIIQNSPFVEKERIQAVKQVSFSLWKGQTLGIIGESGCGKSTLANLLARLIEPSEGKIELFGEDITHMNAEKMRHKRKNIQMIFQYTNAVLDPKMTLEALLREPLILHKIVAKKDINKEIDRLLNLVGLPVDEKGKFPSQLSGGQNQRIIIARAIATRAKLIICDEPVSALDVSIQSQILDLLNRLKDELDLTYLFISHDIKVIAKMCDHIAVMYQGQLVEVGETRSILKEQKNVYTKQLLESSL